MKKVREEVKGFNRQMNQIKSGDVTRSELVLETLEVMGISLTRNMICNVMNVRDIDISDHNVLLPSGKNSTAESVKDLVTKNLSAQICSKKGEKSFLSFRDTESEDEEGDEHMINLVALVSEKKDSKSAVDYESDDDREIDPTVEYRKLYDN